MYPYSLFVEDQLNKIISMKEFIEYLVKNLVDNPNAVQVQCSQKGEGFFVEVRVGEGDVGKVVGRRGATIKAIRTIAMTACARLGQRVRVEILES